jgi:two-component system sensor histidine kinase MprB
MSFRTRLTVLTSLAAAVALVGASIAVYYSYRHDLIQEADRELSSSLKVRPLEQTVSFVNGKVVIKTPPGWTPDEVQDFPIYPVGYSTALTAHMQLNVPTNDDAKAAGAFRFQTVSVHGRQTRRMTILGSHPRITVDLSLTDIDRSLSHLRWLLVFTCLGGIAVATLLSAVVSRQAIAPLRRLTETTERIANSGDLSARTEHEGRDEISRLSAQLDALLATLEQSVETQRQLVADASHELRTPLATLRANVGLLAQPNSLSAAERGDLVADVEEELESMTTLVGELVELAHGDELDSEPATFPLDQVVRSSVDRAARRTPAVAFHADLEPTTIIGVPERVERAVDNLLDNARKWSPEGATVDVSVRNGVVEVRDRGPGIADEDAPLVFNRFYRSVKARGTPGAGLGLAIVKQVADTHNGTVSVLPAPGGGAILRLSFSPLR